MFSLVPQHMVVLTSKHISIILLSVGGEVREREQTFLVVKARQVRLSKVRNQMIL